ncbi:MAG: hypothetical protein WCG45_06230, partial [bacterium]
YQQYLNEGLDENTSVWVTCFVAFKNHDNSIFEFLNLWYSQTLKYSTQDQIGFVYSINKTKINILTLPNHSIKGVPHQATDFYVKHEHKANSLVKFM